MNTVNELHTDRTTISLSKENYETLKRLGCTGESFNDVLSKVLQQMSEENR